MFYCVLEFTHAYVHISKYVKVLRTCVDTCTYIQYSGKFEVEDYRGSLSTKSTFCMLKFEGLLYYHCTATTVNVERFVGLNLHSFQEYCQSFSVNISTFL